MKHDRIDEINSGGKEVKEGLTQKNRDIILGNQTNNSEVKDLKQSVSLKSIDGKEEC